MARKEGAEMISKKIKSKTSKKQSRANETCMRCGVERGVWVVPSLIDPPRWALDLDLAVEYPEAWGKPRKVLVRDELCNFCRKFLNL